MLTILVIFTFFASLATLASGVLNYGAVHSPALKVMSNVLALFALLFWTLTATALYSCWVYIW